MLLLQRVALRGHRIGLLGPVDDTRCRRRVLLPDIPLHRIQSSLRMRFAYLRDPLFLACFVAYWAHRWLAANGMSTSLLRRHLNDVMCIPFWLPMMLWANRRLGLRSHDRSPDAIEIVVPLLIWSALFEVIIPMQEVWHIPTVADPYDVLSYCIGAMAAAAFWRVYYGRRRLRLPAEECEGGTVKAMAQDWRTRGRSGLVPPGATAEKGRMMCATGSASAMGGLACIVFS